MSTAVVEKTRRRTKNQGRRAEIEEWLDSHGVEWEYVSAVPIADFDIEKGLANQARIFNPLDEATVETYTEAIKRGDPFPAVVAARSVRTTQNSRSAAFAPA